MGDLAKTRGIGNAGERPFVLFNFAILLKAFLLLKREKSAGFLQSAYLAVILSTSENVRGVESSRLGVCARLVGHAVSRRWGGRRVGAFSRFDAASCWRVGDIFAFARFPFRLLDEKRSGGALNSR